MVNAVKGWFVWLTLLLLEATILFWTWPGVKWVLTALFGRTLPDPTFQQAFLLWFFVKVFVFDGFSREAGRQADKERAAETFLSAMKSLGDDEEVKG